MLRKKKKTTSNEIAYRHPLYESLIVFAEKVNSKTYRYTTFSTIYQEVKHKGSISNTCEEYQTDKQVKDEINTEIIRETTGYYNVDEDM